MEVYGKKPRTVSDHKTRGYKVFKPGCANERGSAMLNKRRYIKERGLSCPFCGSSSIEGGFIKVETGKAFQKMCCAKCEERWQDIYELIDVRICHDH